MDGGLGDADFLDGAVPAAEGGKAVAREYPETAATTGRLRPVNLRLAGKR
jgi:hypothetical protein